MNTQLFLFEDFSRAANTIIEAIKAVVRYILVTGESGVGKSSLMTHIKAVLDACSYRIVYLQDQKLNLSGLVRVLARKLRLPIRRTNAETIQDMATVLTEEPGHTVIWLDEAHLVPDETLSAVRSLVEASPGLKSKVSVILCGLPGSGAECSVG
jgi:type II secretory pathway predicted ATPase ExeA